jgi:putative hydrolase of the HAD superfamily
MTPDARGKSDVQKENIVSLFLDIGGVLLTNGWDHIMRQGAARKFNLDYEEMNERHHLTFDTYEEGKLTLDQYLKRVVFYHPRSFSEDEFKDYMFAQSKPKSNMIDLVKTLKKQYGLKIAAVSNEGRELTIHRVDTFGLSGFIDFFISSCFVHMRKPDEDMYRLALDCAQVPAEQVVYIDDRLMFIEVSGAMGIKGIHHKDFESTRRALADFGLKS